ncbi:MAG: hypothetical protein HYU36_03800 [Planctomycetes bacterium]|nr:hypothetical protein [Planctomycetota bacterium]
MFHWWLQLQDVSIIKNGLKGLAIGVLCNIYFFCKDSLEKLFEALVLWVGANSSEVSSQQIQALVAEASNAFTSAPFLESGYLISGILVLLSCTLVGVWDGLRERKIRELQGESVARARRLEEAQDLLVNVQRRLAHSERLAAIGRMAAGVSHEINNPLAAISGHLRLLSMQILPDDPRQPILDVMQKEARRIRGIVRGLNDFARHQPDPQEIRKTTASMHEILDEAVQAFRPRLAECHVEVVREFAPHNPVVYGKKDHLRLAFNNLIANAIEAMPQGGVLTLRTACSVMERANVMELKGFSPDLPQKLVADDGSARRVLGGEGEFSLPMLLREGDPVVRVEVRDSGIGIPPELLGKLFEPFMTTKEVGHGLGLGLAITYSIVRSHGGYIEVQSRIQKGSQFNVVLAAAMGPSDSTPATTVSQEAPSVRSA